MEKVWVGTLKKDPNYTIDTEKNRIFALQDGNLYKEIKLVDQTTGKNITTEDIQNKEAKIMCADQIHNVPEIVLPECAVYRDFGKKMYCGYIMKNIRGVAYTAGNIARKDEDKLDLHRYAEFYLKLEDAVKRANAEGIIMPDMCSLWNIILASKKGDVRFIDYDGMQVKDNITRDISNVYRIDDKGHIEEDDFYPKYRQGEIFSDNIDKKSLLYIYLKTTFNMSPTLIKTLTENGASPLIHYLHIKDTETKNAIAQYWDSDVDNDYLGNTVMHIADNYDLKYNIHESKVLTKAKHKKDNL